MRDYMVDVLSIWSKEGQRPEGTLEKVNKMRGQWIVGGLCLSLAAALLPTAAAQVNARSVQERLRVRFGDAADSPDEPLEEALATFYGRRDFQPAWIDSAGLTEDGALVVESLRMSRFQGLEPEDYDLAAIRELVSSQEPERLAVLDTLMTGAFLRYCYDIRSGRADPRDADPEWFVEADGIDHLTALEESIADGSLAEVLEGLMPPDPRYARLRKALEDYRRIAAGGGWPRLPEGPALKANVRHPAVVVLRKRLWASGDFARPDGDDLFNEDLEAAVVRFQDRHGLDADGVVGRKTNAALNVPVEERARQIVLNMERWRWMPRYTASRYILVNMAGFEMRVIENDVPTLRMRVVIGRPYRRTPAFTEAMTYVVVNPYWHIPPSLAVRDLLPKIREDPGYLERQGIRVFSDCTENAHELDGQGMDWSEISSRGFPYKLRQDPGPHNALGRIKFMLPNRFNIYLHDTPHREHFDLSVRAFSSGCIRLEEPLVLADYILGEAGWSPERIRETIAGGERRVVSLPRPIPVILVYWTAWVEKDGTVNFRDDVYGRDKLLVTALEAGVPGGIRTGAGR